MNTIYFSCERAGKIMARPVYEPKKYYVGGAVGWLETRETDKRGNIRLLTLETPSSNQARALRTLSALTLLTRERSDTSRNRITFVIYG